MRKVFSGEHIIFLTTEVLSTNERNAAKVNYGIWGLIVGAVVAMILGFGWGGWTTAGTTERKSTEAVLAVRSAICVAQFMKQPDHEVKLKEFAEVKNWDRDTYIKKGGWDKMPGQTESNSAVCYACAEGLALLIK